MRIRITNFVENREIVPDGDFDEEWTKLGQTVKDQLRTFDPNVTWVNLYVSHDGRPSLSRTIERLTQEQDDA
jgi:hypothetical protein